MGKSLIFAGKLDDILTFTELDDVAGGTLTPREMDRLAAWLMMTADGNVQQDPTPVELTKPPEPHDGVVHLPGRIL